MEGHLGLPSVVDHRGPKRSSRTSIQISRSTSMWGSMTSGITDSVEPCIAPVDASARRYNPLRSNELLNGLRSEPKNSIGDVDHVVRSVPFGPPHDVAS